MKQYCPYCGKKLENKEKICPTCHRNTKNIFLINGINKQSFLNFIKKNSYFLLLFFCFLVSTILVFTNHPYERTTKKKVFQPMNLVDFMEGCWESEEGKKLYYDPYYTQGEILYFTKDTTDNGLVALLNREEDQFSMSFYRKTGENRFLTTYKIIFGVEKVEDSLKIMSSYTKEYLDSREEIQYHRIACSSLTDIEPYHIEKYNIANT